MEVTRENFEEVLPSFMEQVPPHVLARRGQGVSDVHIPPHLCAASQLLEEPLTRALAAQLESCSFVAIDEEMTGIRRGPCACVLPAREPRVVSFEPPHYQPVALTAPPSRKGHGSQRRRPPRRPVQEDEARDRDLQYHPGPRPRRAPTARARATPTDLRAAARQVGVCLFHEEEGGALVARPYNFIVFPDEQSRSRIRMDVRARAPSPPRARSRRAPRAARRSAASPA